MLPQDLERYAAVSFRYHQSSIALRGCVGSSDAASVSHLVKPKGSHVIIHMQIQAHLAVNKHVLAYLVFPVNC